MVYPWAAATLGLRHLTLAFPTQVRAYLDPGTGSFILQLLVAGLLGLLLAIRIFWGRIKATFQRLFARGSHPAAEGPDER